jgi:hypothetical protein
MTATISPPAAAARKGWVNRRRGYPRSWDEV